MYVAKRSGKDCGRFRSLQSPENVRELTADGQTPGTPTADRGTGPVTLAALRRVAQALERQPVTRFASVRKQERQCLPAACVLYWLAGSTTHLERQEAYVRTISTGGVGLLASRPLRRGDLVEVQLLLEGRPQFLAGLVAFSRKVETAIHEVGVQVFNRARRPILSENPQAALRELDWAAQAVGDAGAEPSLPLKKIA